LTRSIKDPCPLAVAPSDAKRGLQHSHRASTGVPSAGGSRAHAAAPRARRPRYAPRRAPRRRALRAGATGAWRSVAAYRLTHATSVCSAAGTRPTVLDCYRAIAAAALKRDLFHPLVDRQSWLTQSTGQSWSTKMRRPSAIDADSYARFTSACRISAHVGGLFSRAGRIENTGSPSVTSMSVAVERAACRWYGRRTRRYSRVIVA
jgi:hypothetical protein